MVYLTYRFSGDMFADGAGGDQHLIDLTERLSSHYGSLVRQCSAVKVRAIWMRVYNPATAIEDQTIACSGKYIFMEPTAARKKALRAAFDTVQVNRRLLGLAGRGKSYDFRVGLAPDYSTDVGAFNQGVKFNAWVQNDDEPLFLAGHNSQGIMDVYNSSIPLDPSPQDDPVGFGTWIDEDSTEITPGENVDFITNEENVVGSSYGYYVEGRADEEFETLPFACAFSSRHSSSVGVAPVVGDTSSISVIEGPVTLMCGLLGVYVDTTTVDDSATQTADYGVEITVDVESWDSLL